jgi:hypothetical protein
MIFLLVGGSFMPIGMKLSQIKKRPNRRPRYAPTS